MGIFVLNTVIAGVDVLEGIMGQMPIEGVIGLDSDATSSISGYVSMREYCLGRGLRFVGVKSYALRDATDRAKLEQLPLDLLLVIGWQRLVPGWLIRQATYGAIGGHGSGSGITGGRGRSPLNWSLLLRHKRFFVSIFRLDPSVDAGPVIDTRPFELDVHDDIRSAYYKSGLRVAEMLVANYSKGRLLSSWGTPQESEARYYPQRLPQDGEIDWYRSAEEIDAFVRALTRPYPGAFSRTSSGALQIWRATPFCLRMSGPARLPGSIVRVFASGEFLIQTGKGLLLVNEYSLSYAEQPEELRELGRLPSADFPRQIRAIVERHQKAYPDRLVVDELLHIAEAPDRPQISTKNGSIERNVSDKS